MQLAYLIFADVLLLDDVAIQLSDISNYYNRHSIIEPVLIRDYELARFLTAQMVNETVINDHQMNKQFIRLVHHIFGFCKSYKFHISEFYAKCSKYIPVRSGLF